MIPPVDLFQQIGGTQGCRELAEAFYARVDRDPLLRPLFPGKSLHCAMEELAAFLVQMLGGPGEDSQRRWRLGLHESHRKFRLEQRHRTTWLRLMNQALEDAGIEEPARGTLGTFFENASANIVDSQAATPPMPVELEHRWSSQQALDEAEKAIQTGDVQRAIEAAARCDGPLLPGLLARMIVDADTTLRDYVHERLAADPALAHERYGGRTLLHVAAGAGDLRTVKLLLKMGVDPDVFDGGKHTPLYSVGNQCASAESADVVRVLVRAGARVDARDGVTGATPLHMAARRGNAVVAKALLECGATIGIQDRRGDTPLDRAIHCRKVPVAELLQSWPAGAPTKSRY